MVWGNIVAVFHIFEVLLKSWGFILILRFCEREE